MAYDKEIPPSARFRTLRTLTLLLLGAVAASSRAEIFRYSDAQGRAVFTDHVLIGPHYRLVWRSSVGKIDAALRPAPRRSIDAGRSRRWRNKSDFAALIEKVARETHLSADLLHAVVQAESAYNPRAKSTEGAMGLMQLMPATAQRYGVTDAWDPVQNLSGGAHYLRDLLDLFENNLRLALAAYNAGEGAVIQNGNRIPPYPETREYVRRVIDNFKVQRQQSDS